MKKILIAAFIIALLYLLGMIVFYKRVPIGTYVAQNNISFIKYSDLEETLENIITKKKMTFKDNGKVYKYPLKDLGINVKKDTQNIMKNDKQVIKWFHIGQKDMTFNLLNINEDKIADSVSKIIKDLGMDAPKDAYIYYEDGSYNIQPEVNTNMIDANSINKAIKDAIKKHNYTINTKEYYKSPSIYKEDLEKPLQKLNNLIQKEITLKFEDENYNLSSYEISSFINVKKDGSYTIDEKGFESYINNISYSYDTIEYTAKKRTQNIFNVQGVGTEFKNALSSENNKTTIKVKNEPFIKNLTQKAGATEKTYIEVNLTSQYMWYYKDGKLFMSSPVVTGDHSQDWDTPTGKFTITEKKEDKILDGSSVGFDYQYPVDYWMRITNSGVGFHDTRERGMDEYGSDTYLYGGGSHGCINLPPANAQKLYENLKMGTVVYVTQ